MLKNDRLYWIKSKVVVNPFMDMTFLAFSMKDWGKVVGLAKTEQRLK
jgi:hypothetical protein